MSNLFIIHPEVKINTKLSNSILTYEYLTYSNFITEELLICFNLDYIEKDEILTNIKMVNIIKQFINDIYENKYNYFENEIINKSVIPIVHIKSYLNIIENCLVSKENLLDYCDNIFYQWMIIYDIIREFSVNSNNIHIKKKYSNIPAFIKKIYKINNNKYIVGYICINFG